MDKNFKKRIISFAIFFGSFCVFLSTAEIVTRLFLFSAEEKQKGLVTLWSTYTNFFAQHILSEKSGCSFGDSLTPHPILGFVYQNETFCGNPLTNNVGMGDPKTFPKKRQEDFYDILLTGGSVAEHLSGVTYDQKNWLEFYLNQHFMSPNGRPFRIFSGAVGSWIAPAPLNFVNLYG